MTRRLRAWHIDSTGKVARVHVALRRRDAGAPGEQLQLVNGNAIVGEARQRLVS